MSNFHQDSVPFFSIVIPTRDRSDLIEGLIWSILEQSFQEFELIVCDNSNNGLTQEVLSNFEDDRIVNITTGNLEMSENYNVGINASSGKYLMCISDKGFLKQGALRFLYDLIINEKHQCITWALDNFVYPGTFVESSAQKKESRLLESSYILKFMLGADYRNYEFAPMHCTSCISMKLVSDIRSKHINLCQAQNPDYTMAAQILLATSNVYNLKQNLAILRNVSTKDGYGTGHSLAKKTKESRQFLKDHSKWIEYTNKFSDVPIKDCPFIIDLMLKDTYKVLEDNEINPDIYLSKTERIICYYFFAYEEILWRKRLGVNMDYEYNLWLEALSKENKHIKNKVKERKKSLLFISISSHFKYLVKSNWITAYLLDIYRSIRYSKTGKKYNDIKDCYRENVIENYIN